MKRKTINALVWKEDNLFVARAVGIELASQGKTRKEALENLQEALDLLLEDEKVEITLSKLPQEPELHQVYA